MKKANSLFDALNAKTFVSSRQIKDALLRGLISRNEASYLLYCNGYISLSEYLCVCDGKKVMAGR